MDKGGRDKHVRARFRRASTRSELEPRASRCGVERARVPVEPSADEATAE